MLKNYRKKDFVVVLVCLSLVFGFYFLNLGEVKASPGTVEFIADVILDLTGLDTTTYVGTGSKADSLTISGTDLTVYGVWDNISFLLKTADHKVLELSSLGGTVDFTFSSNYVSNGYVRQWTENSSVSVSHIVGVPGSNTDYTVKIDGIEFGIFNSGPGAEISFTRTGVGTWEVYTIEPPLCQNHNVWGYAWSENTGWISFSCSNGADYGVDIDVDTGIFSGYAWSENIGWISFEPADLVGCPSGTCKAELDLDTFEVSGWARSLANNGGWDGWIKLDGIDYGVSLNSAPFPSEFEGWAWSDVVIGWISFNCNNTGVCASSDYKVMTSLNFTPSAFNLNVTEGNYCFAPNPPIYLNWTFDDSGDTQSAYQVQIDNNSNFNSPEIDSGKVISVSDTYAPVGLSFNTTYYWRLKVWDSQDLSSDWIYPSPSSFTTDSRWPWPDFTWDPSNPLAEQDVDFTNETNYCLSCSYKWDFNDGSPLDTSKDPTHVFLVENDYSVSLTSTSSIGSCTRAKTVSVGAAMPLPKWKEIAPF